MRILAHLFAVAVVTSGPAFATIEDCMALDADLDRLACYDRETGRTPTTVVVPNDSKWVVSIETSEMTDQKNIYISVVANEDSECRFGGDNRRSTLIVRCLENTTSVYLSTSCHLTSSNYDTYGNITYRLDDTKSKTRGFDASSNNRALGLWRGNKAIPFIKEMLGHNRMLMRFTPFSENARTATFDISGLDGEIAPLRKACNW